MQHHTATQLVTPSPDTVNHAALSKELDAHEDAAKKALDYFAKAAEVQRERLSYHEAIDFRRDVQGRARHLLKANDESYGEVLPDNEARFLGELCKLETVKDGHHFAPVLGTTAEESIGKLFWKYSLALATEPARSGEIRDNDGHFDGEYRNEDWTPVIEAIKSANVK